MKIEIPENLDEEAYPLAWLLGKWHGSALVGGNWGVKNEEADFYTSFNAHQEFLEYETVVKTNQQTILQELGTWRISTDRPELLDNHPLLFPLEISTHSHWFGADTATLSSEYVGIIGKGRVEITAKNIHLLRTDDTIGNMIFNDLSATKQMFGYVNSRLLWAYDLSFCSEKFASIFAGSMQK
jgi:hypothetical protein